MEFQGRPPVYALIPAGGKGSRMGRPKLALPVDGVPVLARVVRALRTAQADHVLVVLAPGADDLARLALVEGAAPVFLPGETPEMRETAYRLFDAVLR